MNGILIHPHEVGEYWCSLLERSGLDCVALHPVGGKLAHQSLQELLDYVKTPEFKAFASRMHAHGIQVEYEFHALSWLLPREEFSRHPHWFRMDESGVRQCDFNCCASSQGALQMLEERAALLCSLLPRTSVRNRYFFWVDDVPNTSCHCPECSRLSPSDQALILYHHILRGIRRSNPEGQLAYLAYENTVQPPKTVTPEPGIFLEFAPFHRSWEVPLTQEGCIENAGAVRQLQALLEIFPAQQAQVLEYWMDNSMFSNWQRPYGRLPFHPEVIRRDAAFYRWLGINAITSFGCYLGEEYARDYGPAPVDEYAAALGAVPPAL